MPFFAPLPQPDPEPEMVHRHYDWPGRRPDHWLPGASPDSVVLARTPSTALVLCAGDVYPRGMALRLLILGDPAAGEDDADLDPWGHVHVRPSRPSPLRLGLEWSDGRRAELATWGAVEDAEPDPDAFRLVTGGGGGGQTRQELELWLTPLPPAEPVTVHVLWDQRGVAEQSVAWDLAPIVARAASAVELWHLDPPPSDGAFGWMAYSPMGGIVVQQPAEVDWALEEDVDEAAED
jgi:hypothetical protein